MWKRFCCRMSWHGPTTNVRQAPSDPLQFLVYARCEWCGFEGMIDSQGNLF